MSRYYHVPIRHFLSECSNTLWKSRVAVEKFTVDSSEAESGEEGRKVKNRPPLLRRASRKRRAHEAHPRKSQGCRTHSRSDPRPVSHLPSVNVIEPLVIP